MRQGTLRDIAEVGRGLALGVRDRRLLDKAARDRIAIFEPALAPLLRRVRLAPDIEPWHAWSPARWLLAIPPGWTAATFGEGLAPEEAWARLAERYPPMAEALGARRRRGAAGCWWELDRPLAQPGGPKIVWPARSGGSCFALDESGALVGPDVCFIAADDPFLLGVLGSRAAWGWLTSSGAGPLGPRRVGSLPVPEVSADERERIGALAVRLREAARDRAELRALVRARTLRELAPPGATLGARLDAWWELDFDGYRAEVTRRLGGDIPFRYRESFDLWFSASRADHQRISERIAALEDDLDRLVTIREAR